MDSSESTVSPYLIAEIAERFGAKPDPSQQRARFVLRDCSVKMYTAPTSVEEVKVLELSFRGIVLLLGHAVPDGLECSVEFPYPGLKGQRVPCRVDSSTRLEGDVHHVMAHFATESRQDEGC